MKITNRKKRKRKKLGKKKGGKGKEKKTIQCTNYNHGSQEGSMEYNLGKLLAKLINSMID